MLSRFFRFAWFAAAIAFCAAPTFAAITVTGNVSPSDPSTWTIATISYIGSSADGSVTADGGSDLIILGSRIGYASGVSGTATVSGTGSEWMASGSDYVGFWGTGTLNVTGGGSAGDFYCYVGYSSGSVGTVNISGTGSVWTPSAELHVGFGGTGSLNVTSGGSVGNRTGYIGYNSGSVGTANVSGTGSVWTSRVALYVGFGGTGSLNVTSGGSVGGGGVYIGGSRGSVGTATVSGIGSKWTNSFEFYVGQYGTGTLNIRSGGYVSDWTGYVGYWGGSLGAVTVSGTGSVWANSADLYVGSAGTGTLNIADGGLVAVDRMTYVETGGINFDGGTLSTGGLRSSLTQLHGTGVINARGIVSDVNLTFDSTASLKQTFTVNSYSGQNLTVNLDLTSASGTNGELGVGYSSGSRGLLSISNGANINSLNGYLGYDRGSSGTATVSGTGSSWVNSNSLYVGYNGTGILQVIDGGSVTCFNSALTTTSVATISGPGAKWTCGGTLSIYSFGKINILNGGTLSTSSFWNGANPVVFNFGGGTLQLTSSTTVSFPMTLTGMGGNSNVDTNGYAVTFLGTLSGVGGLNKVGSGTLTLSGGNTFTGPVSFGGGEIAVSSLSNLGSGSTLNFDGGGIKFLASWATYARTVLLNDNGGSFNTNGFAVTFSGSLSGVGGLTKIGSGALTLSGSNSFVGETDVLGGTLFVNSSLKSSNKLVVNSKATVGGTGTICQTIVSSGGTIAPGVNSTGTLTLAGDLTINEGAKLAFELGAISASDKIAMTSSTLHLSTLEFTDFTFIGLSTIRVGTYTLIDAAMIDGGLGTKVSGWFSGGYGTLALSGNDVVLNVTTAVPEPTALALLLTACGLGYIVKRRR